MTVKALGPYEFPAADRKEVYGDNQLVHVKWDGHLFLCAAACFPVPTTMRWADFRTQMVDPLFSGDPDFDPAKATNWRVDDRPITPGDDDTFETLGVEHKGMIRFEA